MTRRFLIVETDNFDGDYPYERFVNIPLIDNEKDAREIASAINKVCSGERALRYWKVVEDGYKLSPGFEP